MDAALLCAVEEAYELAISDLGRLPGGHIHDVWAAASRRGPVVLKRYRGVSPDQLLRSLEVQQAAHRAGLPVPAVIPNARGGLAAETPAGWVTVQVRAPGSHRETGRFTLALAESTGRALGRLHRALAGLARSGLAGAPAAPDPDEVRRECEAWLDRLRSVADPDEWDLLAVEEAEYRLRLLPRHTLRPAEEAVEEAQWTHGDFYPGNLLYDERDQVTAVLDWDFAAFRPPGGEVARAAFEVARSGPGKLDRGRFDAFLAAYAAEVPLTADQRALMFRRLFFHQLSVLYPLALRRLSGAALPAGWQALARRRYEIVREIEQSLDMLTEWALASNR